jgi:hypothetical protein
MCRSIENGIYLASVNYALRYQESATSIIDPTGSCVTYLPYGQEGILVYEIDTTTATGLLASRYAPERYQEFMADSCELWPALRYAAKDQTNTAMRIDGSSQGREA